MDREKDVYGMRIGKGKIEVWNEERRRELVGIFNTGGGYE